MPGGEGVCGGGKYYNIKEELHQLFSPTKIRLLGEELLKRFEGGGGSRRGRDFPCSKLYVIIDKYEYYQIQFHSFA